MTSRQHDATRAIAREMERAERARRSMLRIGLMAALLFAMLAVVLVSVAVAKANNGSVARERDKPATTIAARQVDEPPAPAEESSAATVPQREESAAREGEPEAAEAPRVEPEPAPAPARAPAAQRAPTAAQRVTIRIGDAGYEPATVEVKAGTPVRLTVGKGEGCAAGFLMPELGLSADNSSGPATLTLPPLKPGVYRFTCGMEMVEGRIVVS